MDIKDIVVLAGSIVLSIGAVTAFLAKVLPKITKYLHIAKEALDVADYAIEMLKDGAVTKEEIDGLMVQIGELKADFKA